ncbi:YbhB/YbcL family Raf kinase inhibitor-like protein [Galbitalea sp. SE-J8]|uniref:YbhB/YbcL family Raf kinase inhibitor-like protein n=1 Tax=Galbitalea sp. SE-J8 TaxID=3054952 RepID=UPI00259CEEB2|nr:YbhB/YbcL family Raf kinase inhibitor-like protein [Galbitalea sp. SE-J8]MDM4762580.1 YbhB/YbcL family Raf kinase inhibitor-like protein [Galbitalea sp. SE-J8]
MANDPYLNLPEVPSFTLTSPDVVDGAALPSWARGGDAGGEDRSPALAWSGAPAETRGYALTVYDPDAPTGSGFWHWAVFGIPGDTSALPAGAGDPDAGLLPAGTVTLPNEMRTERYIGAAPPAGHGVHRYFFTLSALDTAELSVPPGATPAVLGFLMRESIVARAHLVATSVTP